MANGVRVALLLLGVGVAAGGYVIWQANQRPAVTDAAAPSGDAAVPAASDAGTPEVVAGVPVPEPIAPEEAAPEEAAPEPVTPEPVAAEPVAPEPVAPEPPAPVVPTFDVVRIEADGAALIAGTAPADARISLRLDGVEEVRVQAGKDGAFVAQFALPPNPAPRLLSMVAVLADGTELAADETVAVAPVAAVVPLASASDAAPEPEPPAAILLTDEGAEVIQGPTPLVVDETTEIALDTIAYAPNGAVQLSGRGQGDRTLRIYLDNLAVMEATTGADGKWAVTLPETAPGIYTLRIDQMAADGSVSSRFETPFKRETLEALAAASGADPAPAPEPETAAEPEADVVDTLVAGTLTQAEPVPEVALAPEPAPDTTAAVDPAAEPDGVAAVAPEPVAVPESTPDVAANVVPAVPESAPAPAPVVAEPVSAQVTVTVQPGFTLWGIATEQFGEGTMYVQVFEANRSSIKNPDLIYPGQVFTLPQE
jgi:nucleoid-associated protein YgaU